MKQVSEGGWYYQMVDLGYNYRITELQAALGVTQFERLETFVARRNFVAQRYDDLLTDLSVTCPAKHADSYSAYHLYSIQVKNRAQFFAQQRANWIGVNVNYIPVHTQPFWTTRGFKAGDFPEAEAYYSNAISIPVYYGISEEAQDKVVAEIAMATSAN